MLLRILLLGLLLLGACSREASESSSPANPQAPTPVDARVTSLHDAMKKVEPFFQRMGKPQPADWLTAFHEDGQTFDQWLASSPTLPSAERNKIYVLPLGQFSEQQKKIIK